MSARHGWLLAACACFGCIDPTPERQWSYEEFTAELGVLLCRESLHCSDPAKASYGTLERCARLMGRYRLGWALKELQTGDVVFHPEATAQCLDWIARQRTQCRDAADPWYWSRLASPCLAVFQGARQVGEPCDGDSDCATLVCFVEGNCGKGRCHPVAKEGEACPPFDRCGAGMHCGTDRKCHAYHRPSEGQVCDAPWECQTGLICRTGKCRQPSGPGDWCESWWSPLPVCGKGLICDESSTLSVCVAPPALGGDCSAWQPCGWGLVCDGGVCLRPAKDGEVCTKARATCTGLDRACLPAAAGVERCVPLPDVGEPCAPKTWATSEGRRCQVDLYCNPTHSVCQKQTGRGQPCGAEAECAFGTDCIAGQCVEGRAVGDPCDPDASWSCDLATWCNQGKCAAKLGGGGACGNTPEACAAGLVCLQGKCTIGASLNSPCVVNADCALGLVCKALTCQQDPCKAAQ